MKTGTGIFKVCPKQELASGEYGFFYGGNASAGAFMAVVGGKVFDFGVQSSLDTEPRSTTDKKSKVKAPKE